MLLESALSLAVFLALAASWMLWVAAFLKMRTGQPPLEAEPRRTVPWSFLDVVVALLSTPVLMLAALWVIQAWTNRPAVNEPAPLSPDDLVWRLVMSSAASLVALVLAIVLVRIRAGANSRDLGMSVSCAPRDLLLGVAGFLMLAPAVYVIMLILVQWFPSDHPLIRIVKEHPDPKFFVLSFVSAVVVAPIVEEFMFRVMLQGWLEGVAVRHSRRPVIEIAPPIGSPIDPPPDLLGVPPRTDENPYAPPLSDLHVAPNSVEIVPSDDAAAVRPPPFWPILVTSAIFALLHWGHGPDPIPLFVLAIGLGYLYRQTHRVLPGIIVHMLLNGVSMLLLLLNVYGGLGK